MADVERLRKARSEEAAALEQRAARMQEMDVGSKALANASKASPEMLQKAGLGGGE
jgi:hypothetical protein